MSDTTCPDCGCPEYSTAGSGLFGWENFARLRCAHCGREFDAPREKGEPAPDLPEVSHDLYPACPLCGSRSTRVAATYTKSPRCIIRTYECGGCARKFKAIGKS